MRLSRVRNSKPSVRFEETQMFNGFRFKFQTETKRAKVVHKSRDTVEVAPQSIIIKIKKS